MQTTYDAIIIGGGHNGLITAGLLAKAGQKVLVLEQRDTLGGVAATEELFPGFKFNTGLAEAGLFRPELVEALDLTGLEFIDQPVLAHALQPDGSVLTLWRDVAQAQQEIARFSATDAEKYPAFLAAVAYVTGYLDKLLLSTPPNLTVEQVDQIMPWLSQTLGITHLSRRQMTDFVRLLSLSVADFLNEWFESEALKGLLGAIGLTHTMQGPMAPGTALTFFYHVPAFLAGRSVRGGVGQLAAALAEAARRHGAEIQTGASVARITLQNGRATGVRLGSGDELSAKAIISSADPRRTFFELVGAPHLPVRFMRQIKNIRMRGCTAKLHLALSELPTHRASVINYQLPNPSGPIRISPSLEYLERAFDAAKYGRFSPQPYLEVSLPSVADPSLAPAGQHTLSVTMQYAPYSLREGDWDSQRDALSAVIIETLAGFMPNLPELILHQQLVTPLDFERDYGLSGGDLYHGQLALDQMFFMRPLPGYADYRTPLAGLYLCGAGTHPGGGLSGAPGFNAAREILRDVEA